MQVATRSTFITRQILDKYNLLMDLIVFIEKNRDLVAILKQMETMKCHTKAML
jgi:hypothetical protein